MASHTGLTWLEMFAQEEFTPIGPMNSYSLEVAAPPVEASVKVTVRGAGPLVGAPVKSAIGGFDGAAAALTRTVRFAAHYPPW